MGMRGNGPKGGAACFRESTHAQLFRIPVVYEGAGNLGSYIFIVSCLGRYVPLTSRGWEWGCMVWGGVCVLEGVLLSNWNAACLSENVRYGHVPDPPEFIVHVSQLGSL